MAIQQHGWRQALLYEAGVITVIIIALALLVLRDRPSDLGLENHPENQDRNSLAPPPKIAPVKWRAVFSSRAFWIPSLTVAVISGTCQAVVVTLVPYSIQSGIQPAQAALLVSGFAVFAAVTKVAAGALADRINQRLLLIAAAAFMTISWLIMSLSATYGALLASSCLAGTALGCAMPISAGLLAASFGPARFGRVVGWTYAMTAAFAILAVRFAGSMYDRSGSYHVAFQSFAVLLACLLAMTLLFSPGKPPQQA